MTAEKLLSQLEQVRHCGRGKWQACCPSHPDRTPSLSIQEEEDGRLLLHCFAGCGAAEVLDTLGLKFSDLYPQKMPTAHAIKGTSRQWDAADMLKALTFEVLFVWHCAKHLLTGTSLEERDQERLLLAVSRLQRGWEVCNRG